MSSSAERASVSFRRLRTERARPASVLELAEAYARRMPPTHVFSHTTAAVLHGAWLPSRLELDRRLHVTVPAGTRAPQVAGVVGHEGVCAPLQLVRGLRVTSLLQTWIDLGPMLGRVDLITVADYLCSGRVPRHTPAELREAVTGLAGRRGCRALREAAELARASVESPQETRARLFLVDAGVEEPVVNHEIRDDEGRFVARVDLSWPRFKICIEYEGDGHRTDVRQFRTDITRRERIEELGWRMIRITQDDLAHGGHELLRRVRAALAARAGW